MTNWVFSFTKSKYFTNSLKCIENEFLIRVKTKHGKHVSNRIIPLVQSDLTELKASEKEMIDQVLTQTSNWSLSSIEQYLQDDMPIKISKENE